MKEFKWPYGEKYVNIQQERLGLKNHIYQCGDLTKHFRGVILLEDDLYVSPFFYEYVEATLNKYGENPDIAEISLYKNETNGYVGLPFENMQTGSDVFLMQDVSTWGQCWTEQMWTKFVEWRDSHTEEDVYSAEMPDRIKKWTRAWSKYYNAYVVLTGKYVVYPNVSLTTNFSDAGEHGDTNNSIVQTNLLQEHFTYRLPNIDRLVRYDIFFNNESLYMWLDMRREDLCIDLYGFRGNSYNKRFILTTKKLPFSVIKTYALNMRPIELNVKYDICGNGISLYDTKVSRRRESNSSFEIVDYMLKGFNPRMLTEYLFKLYVKRLLKKK